MLRAEFEQHGEAAWQQQIEMRERGAVILVRGSPLPETGGGGYVVVFDDITQLIAAQRATAWGEVARRLAHEIKNPLTPIQLAAERLQAKLGDKLSLGAARALDHATETIVAQVTAMKNMVDDFRDYARNPPPQLGGLDLNRLVTEVLALYEQSGTRIQANLQKNVPLVRGDPDRLRQVIHNLLQNAQDALSGSSDPKIEVSTELSGGQVWLRISDNGCGFPEAIINGAFEPYVTTKPKGTGLGLAIVKRIIDEHHGTVRIENRTGKEGGRGAAVQISDGITLLKEWATGGQLTMPVIMMSGHGTIDTAVEATRIGAMDFLEKPIALQKLLATVKRALRAGESRAVMPLSIATFGRSVIITELKKRLGRISAAGTAVLMRGERGVMPELYARYLQQPNAPWIDASHALNEASQDLLQQVSSGVLFVGELAMLSRNQQKQLAFLAARAEKSNVRLVSFTAEDPKHLVESQGFDAALMQALAGIVIALPALHEHPEDIPEIATFMLAQLVETRFCPPRNFSTGALNVLRYFTWPGNIEDLAAAVRNLALTSLEEEIGVADAERVLPQFARRAAEADLSLDLPLREARVAFERTYFEHHLSQVNGSIARVAERSGLERTHLYRKLKALGILAGRKED